MNKTSVAINSKCTGSLITAQFGDLKRAGERERERGRQRVPDIHRSLETARNLEVKNWNNT